MRMAGTRFGRALALVGALQLALATGALASAEHPEGNEVRDRPILFEQNDTYYELVTLPPTFHYQALRLASKRTYKDRRGRLAIVDSKEVNDFLRDTFKPSTLSWIGLRYWCGRGRLERSDGTVQKLSQYSNWATPWNTSAAAPHMLRQDAGLGGALLVARRWLPVECQWLAETWLVDVC